MVSGQRQSLSSAIIFHDNYHLLDKVGIQITCFSAQMAVEVVRSKSGILRKEPRKVKVTCHLLCEQPREFYMCIRVIFSLKLYAAQYRRLVPKLLAQLTLSKKIYFDRKM